MKCYIVAEVGSVHDGSHGNAKKLIEAAAECGVDAVKFQTHIAEAETIKNAPSPKYFKGEPRYDYFQRTSFNKEEWCRLASHCRENNVEFLSSPFSEEAFELLEKVRVQKYKIPSGEITNLPLIKKIASSGKKIILSSGMSRWKEIDAAVNEVLKIHDDIILLQCTSEYPCEYAHVGLNILSEMKERYGLPVGLSDHTLTLYASLAAVTLGAVFIERHFTFSRLMYGSDAKHSLEPNEMLSLVDGIRAIEAMMVSRVNKDEIDEFKDMKNIFQKSIVTLVDIPAGAVLTKDMIGVKKPGTGISASKYEEIIGCRTNKIIKKDTLISAADICLE